MVQYIFILGRNPRLSIEEIFSFFRRYSIKPVKNFKGENFLFIETDICIPENSIDVLGGTVAIGEVLCSGENEEIIECLDGKTLYYGDKNKFNYAIWDFSSNSEEILDYLKKRFRNEKFKATRKQLSGKIKMQDGETKNFISSKLIDEQYIFIDIKNRNYFARVTGMSDYEEIEKRDIEKPVRRGKLSISPRLAKIMINLSEVKKGETLLDPFCGIGAVLQEGLLQGIKIIGIDIDSDAINGARKNLEWNNFKKEEYKLIVGDSRRIKISFVKGIATEPDLGERLIVANEKGEKIIVRKTYSVERAKKRIKKFESLMIEILNNLKKGVSGKIVFTSPFIKTFEKKIGRIGCDIKLIIKKTGLKLSAGFPIEDFRENQITGRQIFVLEK